MKLGFTGTRRGMTSDQQIRVTLLVAELGPKEAHHGDCVGADAEFHEQFKYLATVMHAHPFQLNLAERLQPFLSVL